MSEDLYYTADRQFGSFDARRLGRRFREDRKVGFTRLKPHGFWGLYMSRVAGPEYRGTWKGLAPLRLVFHEPTNHWLRLVPSVLESLKPGIESVQAFPNCYLFPVGWSAGIVMEVRGRASLDEYAALVSRFRRERVFLWRGEHPARLEDVLQGMHDTIRSEFVASRPSFSTDGSANPYLVASPIEFEDQGSFWGKDELAIEAVTTMLADGPLPPGKPPLITPDTNTLSVTVLNRGTFVISRRPEYERNVPGCTFSNLKNALLVTMVMQKFHQNARDHKNPLVKAMREEVAETFRQLEAMWSKPHYRRICELHAGIQKLSQEAAVQSVPVNNFYFVQSTFQNTAIGGNAQFVQNGNAPRADTATGGDMSTFNFNAPVTNAAVGDHATFVQNLQNVTVQQLASDLEQAHATVHARAASEAEKADAATIGNAAEEAKKGNKDKAIELLRKVGNWGWAQLKDLASTTAAASLKALLGA